MTDVLETQTAKGPTVAELTAAIRQAIVDGDFAPNQRLIEADLSASFGASRAAVRTALFELANDGLIDRLPNRGSRVRAITLDEAIEILEVRIGLECLCAEKAAQNATDAEIAEFKRLRRDLLEAVAAGDLLGYSRLNQLLDERIRDLSSHETAVAILERLHAQSVRHQFRLAFQPGRAAVSAGEHVAILDAVIARDPAAAVQATRDHLLSVISALRSLS
ncbi:GntR family transcriptional regulator [Naasia aerilata]|uniref:GntR family transcriptional regulator n=1 Tax=Naasia aerilata TaxID=1162966 RepID=A0ABM8GD68_9MICO|nr:GntR family transcriptional regulator [Naasia aerilata]BDZ46211.1 GntR family transcriptional regulator [Naasia aerilata]